jgi:signal transduction histidine kinase
VRILTGTGRGLLSLGRGVRRIGRGLARIGRGLARAGRLLGRVVRHREVRFVLPWLVAVIAAFVAFGTSGTVYDTGRIGWALMPFVGAIAGLPFGLIVIRPLTGLLVSVGAAFVLGQTLPRVDSDPWPWLVVHGLVMLTLLFVTCARERLQRAVGAWLITASLFYWGVPEDIQAGWVVGVTTVAVIGLLAGRLISTNRALARQAEVSSAEKARRVVLEERARIARDLHDIVAHHMSLVVVQTETAGYRVPDLSPAARAELLSIGESARSALTETRALLAVLRQAGQAAEDAPQPGLVQVNELVTAAQRAGVGLKAQISGDLAVLRPGASLAAYRIVQEALANAARHAPGAPVRLEVDAGPAGVRVRVANGPRPGAEPGAERVLGAVGHGITGMRERAAAAGGRVDLGWTDDGGFVVQLVLPTGGEEQSAAGGPGSGSAVVLPPGRPAGQEPIRKPVQEETRS